jgi:hypothetical protein
MKLFKAIWEFIKSFGLFWKDFLVGDSPELALGVTIILGVSYVSRNSRILDIVSSVVLVMVLMMITVWRKTRRHS